MFDPEDRVMAAQFIKLARDGLRGKELTEALRGLFPEATGRAVSRAAFLAVTRPNVDHESLFAPSRGRGFFSVMRAAGMGR